MRHNNCSITGRFAPSPTGALHTGSLVAAVGSWLMAKSAGGRWLLRIDDLDLQRHRPETVGDILRTLESFGLIWDGEISWQSKHLKAYANAFESLKNKGLIYPCCCSRKEIAQAASAPHPEDDCVPYHGRCANGIPPESTVRSWRIRVPDEQICFDDLRMGHICQNLAKSCGDIALKRADGVFAYQLAVVVDDFLTGVTQVVRGDDLLPSTPRQIYLQQQLGLTTPTYCHLPLVTGNNGSKLSKRDNLVSVQTGWQNGEESGLLLEVLQFLGQAPPKMLADATCGEILQWGIEHFNARQIPMTGGELAGSKPVTDPT